MKALLQRAPATFEAGFAAIRRELKIPVAFPDTVAAEAEQAYPGSGLDRPAERRDVSDLGFIAVDPAGATDLDQAFFAEETPTGYRVWYAIADVAAFVRPGGAIDLEARRRGTTLYSPDLRTPLHPPIISEDRASLLPGNPRPCLLWQIDLDDAGAVTASRFERATVHVAEAISYTEAQRRADNGDDLMGLLATIGRLRQAQEAQRGGISLNIPAQEVVETESGYDLVYDESLPIEGWNAQISLLAGMEAGKTMADAGVGILRTLPPTAEQDLLRLRRQAAALSVPWPEDTSYPDLVRNLTSDSATNAAFLLQAARSFRGAGYLAVNGDLPPLHTHGAIASIYAHVTAPLRRLVDRFANEILVALHAGHEPPAWAVEVLDELPSLMGRAQSRESGLEQAMLDFAEAALLEPAIGATFRAVVVDLDDRRDQATVQLARPAIVVRMPAAGRRLAEELTVRLVSSDPAKRTLEFEAAA